MDGTRRIGASYIEFPGHDTTEPGVPNTRGVTIDDFLDLTIHSRAKSDETEARWPATAQRTADDQHEPSATGETKKHVPNESCS